MKAFGIRMPIAGTAFREIIAETEEEAIKKMMTESTFPLFKNTDDTDVEIEEVDLYKHIVEGNVYLCPLNDVEVEYEHDVEDDA